MVPALQQVCPIKLYAIYFARNIFDQDFTQWIGALANFSALFV